MNAKATKLVESKVEGISGNDKVCVLHPYKVLSIQDHKKEKNKKGNVLACIKKFFKKL